MRRALLAAMLTGSLALASQPLVWPLKNTGGRQWVSSGYGTRQAPMGGKTGGYHAGLDLACRIGTPVLAVGDGLVMVCATGDAVYGRYMVIRLGSGMDVLYGHLSETWFKRGSFVRQGQVIGKSGNTGASTGPHLHIALMLNPLSILQQEAGDAH